MKRPRVGDIIEIPLPNGGFGYAQYTHKHITHGYLIRVFNIREKVVDINLLSSIDTLFTTFFPLGSAVNQKIVSIVGNLPLREEYKQFPIFKSGMRNKDGVVDTWWLWDGEKDWKVGELTKQQENFPCRQIMNDTAIIEKIIDVDLFK